MSSPNSWRTSAGRTRRHRRYNVSAAEDMSLLRGQQAARARIADQLVKASRLERGGVAAKRRQLEIPPPLVVIVAGLATAGFDDEAVGQHGTKRPIEVRRKNTLAEMLLRLADEAPSVPVL